MKTLTTLTIVFLLILAFGAFAADVPQTSQVAQTTTNSGFKLPLTGFSVLRLDPMTEEIEIIKKTMLAREDSLLTKLFEAKTEQQSNRVLQQINRLDMDRELAILRVQMRYARLDGRFDLEREIKGKIVSIVTADLEVLP